MKQSTKKKTQSKKATTKSTPFTFSGVLLGSLPHDGGEGVLKIEIHNGVMVCKVGNHNFLPSSKDLIDIRVQVRILGNVFGINKSKCLVVSTGRLS